MKIYYRDDEGKQQIAEVDFDPDPQASLAKGWLALAAYDTARLVEQKREGKREHAAARRKDAAARLAKRAARDQRIAETEPRAA
jgi:hypothetical protein